MRAVFSSQTGVRNPAIGAAVAGLLLTYSLSYELQAEHVMMIALGMALARRSRENVSQFDAGEVSDSILPNLGINCRTPAS